MRATLIFVIFSAVHVWPPTDGLAYSAMSRLEDLASIEKSLIQSLDEFIKQEKSTLEHVVKMAERMKQVLRPVNETEHLLTNPVQVYSLIKRFVDDWSKLGSHITGNNSKDLMEKLAVYRPYFPTLHDDLHGSIAALFLLQDTYNITAKQMAAGNITGSSVLIGIPAEDCLELGLFALQFNRYSRAQEWLREAVQRSRSTNYHGYLNITLMLDSASWAEYVNGNLEEAIKLGVELLQINPKHTQMRDNVMRYRRELNTGLIKTYEHVKADEDKRLTDVYRKTTINRLCREEPLRKFLGKTSMLKCRYLRAHPLLRLKPVKEEVVLASPIKIIIYRDLLSHKDAEKIQDIARPHLQRSRAFNLATGTLEVVPYRISESAWLHERASAETLGRFNKRAEAATGLEVSTAEYLQVANYGFGGQYEEHHDHGYPNSPLTNHEHGNRIATLLLYLSRVPFGGGTAFTQLKTYVRPGKGDAVFWYNLKRSGIGDNSTRHAACPVLTGNKWVANKWFHSHGQEFRRPCLLNENI